MRKKKWLIIIVIIIILINIILLLVPRVINFSKLVSDKLTAQVGEKYNADINFKDINLTTKFLQLSNISLKHEKEVPVFCKTIIFPI